MRFFFIVRGYDYSLGYELMIRVNVWIRVFRVGLGLVWCYGQGKFRDRVRPLE